MGCSTSSVGCSTVATSLREPAFEEEGFPEHLEEKDHHGEEHGANEVEHEVVLTSPHSTLPTHKGKACRPLFVSCLNLWMAASFLAACWHSPTLPSAQKKVVRRDGYIRNLITCG